MTNDAYYLSNQSDRHYLTGDFWERERGWLFDDDARLLTLPQANALPIAQFLNKESHDIKPHLNREYHYIALPYELSEITPTHLDTATIIAQLLNQHLTNPIYVASTDKEQCCVYQADKITADLIAIPQATFINTPFVIFDDTKKIFALVDYDLPLQIIGYDKDRSLSVPDGDILHQGFDDVFKRYAGYINLPMIFSKYYAFLLPKGLPSI